MFRIIQSALCRCQSFEREQSKWDFISLARRVGCPSRPRIGELPLVCRSRIELWEHAHRLAFPGLITRMVLINTLGDSRRDYGQFELHEPNLLAFRTRFGTPILVNPRDEVSEDLAIQEYRGRRVLRVIAIGETPVPLIPQQAKYHQVCGYARFLTLDVKFHAELGLGYEFRENDDPELFATCNLRPSRLLQRKE
jgi:hypothetical protein